MKTEEMNTNTTINTAAGKIEYIKVDEVEKWDNDIMEDNTMMNTSEKIENYLRSGEEISMEELETECECTNNFEYFEEVVNAYLSKANVLKVLIASNFIVYNDELETVEHLSGVCELNGAYKPLGAMYEGKNYSINALYIAKDGRVHIAAESISGCMLEDMSVEKFNKTCIESCKIKRVFYSNGTTKSF
jgi:hypothetical protein